MAVSAVWRVNNEVTEYFINTLRFQTSSPAIKNVRVEITSGALPVGMRFGISLRLSRGGTFRTYTAVIAGTPTTEGTGRVAVALRYTVDEVIRRRTETAATEVILWTVGQQATLPVWSRTTLTQNISWNTPSYSIDLAQYITGTEPITFRLHNAQGLNNFIIRLGTTGDLDVRPLDPQLGGAVGSTYSVEVSASNSAGTSTQRLTITGTHVSIVTPPTRTVNAITHYLAPGQAFTTDFGTTSGTAPFTVSAIGQPSWVTTLTASGASGTAPYVTLTQPMIVTFRNAATGTATLTVTYIVANNLVAPAWTAAGGTSVDIYRFVAGQTIQIPAVDNTPFPSGIAYSMRSVMAGMRFDPSDRQVKDIVATPVTGPTRAIGTGVLTARVNWATSTALQITPPAGTVEDTYTQPYSVLAPSGLGANFAVTSRTEEWNQGSTVDVSLTAPTGTPTPTISTSGTLPTGVSFSTSALRYSGTAPTTGTSSGTHTVTATNVVRQYNPQTGVLEDVPYTSHHVLTWSVTQPTVAPNFGASKQSARQQWLVGSSQSWVLPADNSNPAATITHTELLEGFSFNTATRTLTVTVPNIQGNDEIVFTATNPVTNETDTYTLRFNIYATAGQPLWSPSTFADTVKFTYGYDCAFYLQPVDSGGNPQPTYTYVSGAPAGMAWDETLGDIGAVAGKPTSNDTTGQMLFRANSTAGQGELRVNWAVSDDAFPVWGLQYAISGA